MTTTVADLAGTDETATEGGAATPAGSGWGAPPRGDQSAGAATGVALVGAVVTTVNNFGLLFLVAHVGAVLAGLFFSATALVIVLGNSAGLGTMTGLVYFMPVARAAEPGPNPRGLVKVALGPVVVAGLLGGGLLLVAAPLVGHAIAGSRGDDLAQMLRVLSPAVPAWALTMSALGATRGLGSMVPTVAVQQVGRPMGQLVGVATVLLTTEHPPPWLVAAGWSVPVVAGAVAAVLILWREGGLVGSGPSTVPASEFWRYTRPRSFATALQIALERLDVVLVSALAGPAVAGIYSALSRYITASNFLVFSIGQACGPGLRRTLGGGDPAAGHRLLQQATGWMVLIVWPYLLAVATKPDTFLGLANPEFAGHGAALTVLALFMLVCSAAGPADLALLMLGRSRASLAAVALALSTDLALAWLLIPRFGLMGAAVAWGLAVMAQNLTAATLVRRGSGALSFGRPALVAAAGAVGAVVPIGLWTPDTFTGLVVAAAVAAPLYLLWAVRWRRLLGLGSIGRR